VDRINRFNPNRLKSARLYEGLTLVELATQTGVSKQMISQYENGKSAPGLETLMRIMRVLGFPREYFYLPDNDSVFIGPTFFRASVTANKLTKDSQIEKLKGLSEGYSMLESYIDFPKLNLPHINISGLERIDIERYAEETREYWCLGQEPINNVVSLLEKNGIIISSLETSSNKVDAFSHSQTVNGQERCFIILGNDKKSAVRRQFDAAHELAHLVMHNGLVNIDELSKDEYKEMERQADSFAASFLLPRTPFIKDLVYPSKLDFYVELKKKWRVSVGAMIVRAFHLEVISYNQYQYLMRQMGTKGWRTKEPLDDVITVPEPTLLRRAVDMLLINNVLKVRDILAKLRLTQNKAETLLNLPKGKLIELENAEEKVVQLNLRTSNYREGT